MKQDGIQGAPYREDRAAEQLGTTVDEFRDYADDLGIGLRRMYGQKGFWYLVPELEEVADPMDLKGRKWNDPMRGYRAQG